VRLLGWGDKDILILASGRTYFAYDKMVSSMALEMTPLKGLLIIYAISFLVCILFVKKRDKRSIRDRRAKQTPIHAALAGVLCQDIASILYCFYIRSALPLILLWGVRFMLVVVFVTTYGNATQLLTEQTSHTMLFFINFAACFTSMYASSLIVKRSALTTTA